MLEKPTIERSWYELLKAEFDQQYMQDLRSFLIEDKERFTVYPPGSLIFECFNRTPVDKVRVVIIGQDPYHGQGQAHGLSFSVKGSQKLPPSLQNIFKEIQNEYSDFSYAHGDLSVWADQGVLLLNATLTVRKSQPGSHQNKGWERFTDQAIRQLSNSREHLVFMLWGKFAQTKASLISREKHLILSAPHPSPFSAHKGFFGCNHFKTTNDYLTTKGFDPIDWNIT